jgi:hypothetical protein
MSVLYLFGLSYVAVEKMCRMFPFWGAAISARPISYRSMLPLCHTAAPNALRKLLPLAPERVIVMLHAHLAAVRQSLAYCATEGDIS